MKIQRDTENGGISWKKEVKPGAFLQSSATMHSRDTARNQLTVEAEQKIVQLSVCTGLQRLLHHQVHKIQQTSQNMN